MLEDFLSPIDASETLDPQQYAKNQWGNCIVKHTDLLPDCSKIDIAIVGVEEDRRNDGKIGCKEAANAVRRELYKLYKWQKRFRVADLGNIKAGRTQHDTYIGVGRVVEALKAEKVIPIIIGGTHDVTYGQFLGYGSQTSDFVNIAVFDQEIDLFSSQRHAMGPFSFLYKILTQQPNLFNFNLVGFQHFLVDPNIVNTLEDLHFECHSLGHIRSNIEEVEPIVRNADIVSFDVSAIRQSDAPGVDRLSANGFYGEEACQIARYAGLSDHVSSFGLYQFNPSLDQNDQTAKLAAQMLWYFVDGFYSRKHDHPSISSKGFLQYIVNFKDNEHEIVFVKSKRSDRWWMRVPVLKFRGEEQEERHELVPCSYSDYELACKEEIPDRWMRAYLRLSV